MPTPVHHPSALFDSLGRLDGLDRFGVVTTLFCIACALAVVFSGVLARRLVPLSPWRLPDDPQRTSGGTAARCACLLLMGLAYAFIDAFNALFFLSMAVGCALCLPCLLSRYRDMRAVHVLFLPRGRRWLPVGGESDLHAPVKAELQAARRRQRGLSLHDFLRQSGRRLQRPAAFWPPAVLADQVRLLDTLVVLMAALAATAVFLAVLVVQTLPDVF
ncbi:hypothetical protein GN316_09010 [Xylophilus sp. Kf1]|nr:hypothetical protein [Xylophilus sp. Kf1]